MTMGVSGLGLEGLTSDSGGGGGVPADPFILQGFGVVGAPALAFLGDEDTGLYRPAADQLGLVAGGVEAARIEEVGGTTQFIFPQVNDPVTPTVAFGDGDTGFYENFDDFLSVAVSGARHWVFGPSKFQGTTIGSGAIRDVLASAIVPTLLPHGSSDGLGIGAVSTTAMSLIAGGVEGIRVAESAAVITNTIFGRLIASAAGGPALQNEAGTFNNPSVLPNKTDDDTGIGYGGSDVLDLIAGASNRVRLTSGDSVFRGGWTANTASGPALLDEAASATNPVLLPRKNQPQTGIGAFSTNAVSLIALSTEGFRVAESEGTITNTIFGNLVAAGGGGSGPAMLNVGASASVPTLIPNQADPDTGLSRDTINGLTMIAGGLGCIRARNIGSARAVGFYTTTPIVKQTGVAVTEIAIHAALVALGLIGV